VVAEPLNPSASRLSSEMRMCSRPERDENDGRMGQDSAQSNSSYVVKRMTMITEEYVVKKKPKTLSSVFFVITMYFHVNIKMD